MQINRIELVNFRNHQHLVLDEIGDILIIVGDNAVGKTNIIEALQLMSMHESFRFPKPEELLFNQQEENNSTILVDINTLGSNNTKQITFTQEKRVYFYNKKERPARDLIDIVPAVLFTPDDLQIIKGPPEQRRVLLDSLGSRLSKSFEQIKKEYYKALRHKNRLLKQEEVDLILLDSWNINLAKLGTSLSKHRFGLFEKLLKMAVDIYDTISGGEKLSGNYIVSGEVTNETQEAIVKEENLPVLKTKQGTMNAEQREIPLINETADHTKTEDKRETPDEKLYLVLKQNVEAEIRAKRSLIGPHKDDITFEINGYNARRFASQGQQRSIALALKMAEIELLRRVSGKNPLLLLDDVMSELDEGRRKYFVNLIGEASQTVLTTTNLGYFDEEFLNRSTVVVLEEKESKESFGK